MALAEFDIIASPATGFLAHSDTPLAFCSSTTRVLTAVSTLSRLTPSLGVSSIFNGKIGLS
jgi:hypothetical protein